MLPPEPPLSRLSRLVKRYAEGVFTRAEVASYCISVADSANALELVCQLPSEIFAEVQRQLQDAPATEDAWAKCDVISIRQTPEASSSREQRVARFRASIEALRLAMKEAGS